MTAHQVSCYSLWLEAANDNCIPMVEVLNDRGCFVRFEISKKEKLI